MADIPYREGVWHRYGGGSEPDFSLVKAARCSSVYRASVTFHVTEVNYCTPQANENDWGPSQGSKYGALNMPEPHWSL